ncbi:sugar phosphate isomerase/epimerase family protein [Adhaeribacter pallidiroseus]|uniref:Xylose isomerase-like TIM barrel domain-containing protein n=1 Tax=Adhaeribacter pallidiroseus TaxID=2072847 RepID=A0A369QUJ3_9BACT|nr:xylose isomerase [Adhaeribacter pallidiroseus]RDC65848.1 hypothetical protein AHMF7616_04479 [Adhaeribacter pallidiroseus]
MNNATFLLTAKLRKTVIFLMATLLVLIILLPVHGQNRKKDTAIYARQNLFAWSIVPFDVKKRNPTQRAAMLQKMGITRLAYDWRQEHVATFDEELKTLKKNNIKLQAFWLPTGSDPANDKNVQAVFALLKRHQVKTQLWCSLGDGKNFPEMSQEEKVHYMARIIGIIAKQAAEIGCTVGLYNHSGWFGEPENQLAIIEYLKMPNVGMVYNFNHAEAHVARFAEFFPKIVPHLLALNLSGIQTGNPVKIVPVGQGNAELEMMRVVKASKYRGPVGIINEYTDPDAEVGLQMNLTGLKKILKSLGDTVALKTYLN